MSRLKEFVLLNDVLLAVPCYHEDVPVVLEASIKLDLSEFELTQAEADKLSKIVQKMTWRLSDALAKDCLAASISSEIRPKNKIHQLSAL